MYDCRTMSRHVKSRRLPSQEDKGRETALATLRFVEEASVAQQEFPRAIHAHATPGTIQD